VRQLIAELFEEEALVIGGLVATYEIADEAVWSLVRSLDAIRADTLNRLSEAHSGSDDMNPGPSKGSQPHPAIEELLRRIHEDTPRTPV